MMRPNVITRQDGAKVSHYYSGGADDYYAKDGTAMQWQGKGAEALGLTGAVDPDRFRELLSGTIDKNTHMRRAANGDFNRERLAYDLTFSAPKGVSLQALVHGDRRVVEAHNAAVATALKEAEKLAKARTTVNRKTRVEDTGNLVIGKFRHETSREQEPQLHTHAVVLNMTQRGDGKWRALMSDGLFQKARQIDNVYKAELAKGLEAAGFQIRYQPDGNFDLAHFTNEQIMAFSTRYKQVKERLESQGLTLKTATREQRRSAALVTRKKKHETSQDALLREWKTRATEVGIDFDSREWAGQGAGASNKPQQHRPVSEMADESVAFAVESLTEREAIIGSAEVVETALRHGAGRLGIGDVRSAMARAVKQGDLIPEDTRYVSASDKARYPVAMTRDQWVDHLMEIGRPKNEAEALVATGIEQGRLLKADTRYTTPVGREREAAILAMEHQGRGAVKPQIKAKSAESFLAKRGLSDEQRKAALMIATTKHRYVGVQGFAGVGKSYMTLAAKDLLESKGYRVTSLAPYGSQKKDLQKLGLEARTVASFLRAKDKKIDPKTVVFLDEAGVVPARQMKEVMQTIEQHGARAVLLGDTAQTKAIEAGRPFAQLQAAGMATAHLTDIQRQTNPELLQAVQLAAEGKTVESITHLTHIQEIKEPPERYAQVVKDYAALAPEERDNTLVITGTNESRHALNEGIRRELGLVGTGRVVDLLNRRDTTRAERGDSRSYKVGNVIVPEQTYKNGLERGQKYRVLDTGPGNSLTVAPITAAAAAGNAGDVAGKIQFNPSEYESLSVYDLKQQELAVGDRIRITRNDAAADLANRDQFVVSDVLDDGIEAIDEDGRKIMLDTTTPAFADLAYVSTVHSAQGLTADRVLMNFDTKSRTTNKAVYYVGISRPRQLVRIYTNDRAKLPAAAAREHEKTAALDMKRKQVERRGHDKAAEHEKAAEKRVERKKDYDRPRHARGREMAL